MDYRNKVILAPMGTMPFRLMALEYGADIVYSEEIVDRKLATTKRVQNETLGTIDYVTEKDGSIAWRTNNDDTPTVIQIGTGGSEWALKAYNNLNPDDYDALDINMGCPVKFSTQGGMGVGLLQDRERIKDIVSTLVRNANKPITCKIRLLNTLEDTLDLVKTIEQLGASALAVHARFIPQRPHEPAHLDWLPHITSALSIPVIANGDVFLHEDIANTREITGCSSVMIGRGALWNCSVFHQQMKPPLEVAKEYIERCIQWENLFTYTKYTVLRMFENLRTKPMWYTELVHSKSHDTMLKVINNELNKGNALPVERPVVTPKSQAQ